MLMAGTVELSHGDVSTPATATTNGTCAFSDFSIFDERGLFLGWGHQQFFRN